MNTLSKLAAGAAIAGLMASTAAWADDTISLVTPTWPGFAPALVAKDLGYFDEAGIDVDIRFDDDRSNVMAAMARGDVDMTMRTVGEYQGRPRTADTPGIIIGVIDKSLGGDGVIADGSIKTVADLKGKTIAAEPNIPARLLLQLALKKENLTFDDLNIKDIATADTVAVFADNSIAAVASYEPFMSQAVKAISTRDPHILVSSKDSDIIIDIISVRQDDLADNPEKYKAFLAAVYKAVDYYKTNPDDFIALAAPHFNLSDDEVKEILDTSLVYTDLSDAVDYIGTDGKPGKLSEIFGTVMQLNLENGAAETELSADKQIDQSVITSLAADAK